MLGIWADDVVTVSIYTAESEALFDRHRCEDYAEVYLPWDLIRDQVSTGQETTVQLGLTPDLPWLGQSASPAQYRDAFRFACHVGQDRPNAPQLRIGIREVHCPWKKQQSTDNVVSLGMKAMVAAGLPVVAAGPPGGGAGVPVASAEAWGRSAPSTSSSPAPSNPPTRNNPLTPPHPGPHGGYNAGSCAPTPMMRRESVEPPPLPPAEAPHLYAQGLPCAHQGPPLLGGTNSPAPSSHYGVNSVPVPPPDFVGPEACSVPAGTNGHPQIPRGYSLPQSGSSLVTDILAPSNNITGRPVPPSMASALSSGVDELSKDEMQHFFQLQVRNKELRAQVGLHDDVVDVEDQVQAHLERLRYAIAENYSLKSELQAVDKEMAQTSAGLTQEERMNMTGAFTPPPPTGNSGLDSLENERHAAELTGEIESVNQRNLQLISQCDEEIEAMEAELLRLRYEQSQVMQSKHSKSVAQASPEDEQRLQEQFVKLHTLQVECQQYEAAMEGPARKTSNADARTIQMLQVELEWQQEEIENLKAILARSEEPMMPPNTGVLVEKVDELEDQLSKAKRQNAQDQASCEQYSLELRRDAQEFRAELEKVNGEKAKVEKELEQLKTVRSSASLVERLHQEQLQQKSFLDNELARCTRRIDVATQRIQQLKEEDDDMRQRVNLIMRSKPESTRSSTNAGQDPPDNAQVAELRDIVANLEEEVSRVQRQQHLLTREKQEAMQVLDTATGWTTQIEEKVRMLSRGNQC